MSELASENAVAHVDPHALVAAQRMLDNNTAPMRFRSNMSMHTEVRTISSGKQLFSL